MDWKQLLADLAEAKLTQAQIATRVGCAQSFISELASGKIKEPRWTLGQGLKSLHRQVTKRKRAEA